MNLRQKILTNYDPETSSAILAAFDRLLEGAAVEQGTTGKQVFVPSCIEFYLSEYPQIKELLETRPVTK